MPPSSSSFPPILPDGPLPAPTGTKRAAGGTPGSSKAQTEGAAPKRTRQRAALSCQECRRLKLKCDRNFPCSSCRRRNCADICPSGVSKPPGRAVRVAAEFALLLRRVDELEALVRELGGEGRIPPPLELEEARKRSTGLTREVEEGLGRAGGKGNGKEEDEDDEEDEREGEGERAFGAGEGEEDEKPDEDALRKVLVGVGSLSIAESGRTRFLGPAAGSAYYFEDDATGDSLSEPDSVLADDRRTDPLALAEQIARYPFIQLGHLYPRASELERLRAFLPPEDEARRLSRNYWRYLSFQFTPVEEDVYWTDYFPSAFAPSPPSGPSLACVFIVLALGTLFDPLQPATPNQHAHHFFLLSQAVLSASRFLSNSTLPAIQTLQLSANFLLNSHDFQEGGETLWPLLGVGMKMLAAQGLHRDGESFGLSGAELNRRRRVFYELITLERFQAFISGRPYTFSNAHFDTRMPEDADAYQTAKWKIGLLIGKVIDKAFSVATPSYGTILSLDADLRALVASTPNEVHSGALPPDALVVKPAGIPQIPPTPAPPAWVGSEQEWKGEVSRECEDELVWRQRQHTMDQMFTQVLFYLHKPGFAQALTNHPLEPLKSPWSASVAAVSLESAPYLLAVAKSWFALHPLSPRWWHIPFHCFASTVAQASLVIKSPKSVLAPHAWGQLNEAVAVFEAAGASGAPVAAFVPRLHVLRDKAFRSLQHAIAVPMQLAASSASPDGAESPRGPSQGQQDEEADASAAILAPPTRLERKQRRKPLSGSGSGGVGGSTSPSSSPAGTADSAVSPPGARSGSRTRTAPDAALASLLGASSSLGAHAPPVSLGAHAPPVSLGAASFATASQPGAGAAQPYTPFDEPLFALPASEAARRASDAQMHAQQTPAVWLRWTEAGPALGELPVPPPASHSVPLPSAPASAPAPAPTAEQLAAWAATMQAYGDAAAPLPGQAQTRFSPAQGAVFYPPPPAAAPSSSAYPPLAASAPSTPFDPALYGSLFSPSSLSPFPLPSAPLPAPPPDAFPGFATAFNTTSTSAGAGTGATTQGWGETGAVDGGGGAATGAGADAWAWFNALSPTGGVGGASPLDWSKFGES
ncbi:hypothetical protein JCM10207_005938 [Rhodosporidiobolus poonsookiae]